MKKKKRITKNEEYEANYDEGFEEDDYVVSKKDDYKDNNNDKNIDKKFYVANVDLQIYNEFQEHCMKKRAKNVKIFNIVFTIFGILLVIYGIFTMINK